MTIKRRESRIARIEHVLVFYDGPQLVLFNSVKGYRAIGVAVEKPGFKYPLFCAIVLERHYQAYLSGKVDLLFIFKATPKGRLYFADLCNENNNVPLYKATVEEIESNEYFPEPGIFSTVHTHTDRASNTHGHTQKFLIDGNWEARDFSQFHGKMADTYSLHYIADKLEDQSLSAAESVFLKSSISDKPWQGGGSYLSFYGTVRDKTSSIHPLRVSGIEYHSPGYVDLSGKKDILDKIIASIEVSISKQDEIADLYKSIQKTLKSEGLLGSDRTFKFTSGTLQEYAKKQSFRLCELLQLPNPQGILDACEGEIGVFAKLVNSYCRRVRALAAFYVQGRVRTG
jgi:hypothetical protein